MIKEHKEKNSLLKNIESDDGMTVNQQKYLDQFQVLYSGCKGFREMLLVKGIEYSCDMLEHKHALSSNPWAKFSTMMASMSPALYAYFRKNAALNLSPGKHIVKRHLQDALRQSGSSSVGSTHVPFPISLLVQTPAAINERVAAQASRCHEIQMTNSKYSNANSVFKH